MGDVAFPTNQRNVALSPDDAHPLRKCVVHHQSMCCWRDSTFSRWREQQSTFFCCPQSEINAVFGSDALGLRTTSPLGSGGMIRAHVGRERNTRSAAVV